MDDPDLGRLIEMQIRASGPMSIATYMGLCLSHPRHGYYASGDPLGTAGDFITAPEVSQMFGELLGFFVVNLWQQMGEPHSFTLLELGPGRGTLMSDLLRAASKADGFLDALHLQLFESNPDLRSLQRERLEQYHPYWADEIDAVGEGPLFVVANEFFDALPIRQFVKQEDGWHERQVGLQDDTLAFGLSPVALPDRLLPDAEPGAVFETGIAATEAMSRLAAVVARQGGAILVLDYGYLETQTGETLQAVRNHAFADPLESPGEADLSAHVDFEALAKAAAGLETKLTTQGAFLIVLGINERAATLFRANPDHAAALASQLERLVGPHQMGELFKVLCAHGRGLQPAGFP